MNNMYEKTNFFKSYFSRATEKQIIVESIGKRLHHLKPASKIVDLGCHNGELIRNIVKHHGNKVPHDIKIIGIDPSHSAISEFLANDFTKKYSVTASVTTAEAYFSNHNEHVDWIIASQSLYWSLNLRKIISQIHDQSESALIVLRGKKGIYEIQSQFKNLLGNKQEQLYTSDDIEKSLIEKNISFSKECHTTHIDLPHPDDESFNWLIAFFLQVHELNISPLQLKNIKDFILALSEDNKLNHDIALFWLGRACIYGN